MPKYLLTSLLWFYEIISEQQAIWNEQEKVRLRQEAEQIKRYEEEQERRILQRQAKQEEDQSAKIAVQEALAQKLKHQQVG